MNAAQFHLLSVRQLKTLLTIHRVNFTGVTERTELESRCLELWKDWKRNRQGEKRRDMHLSKFLMGKLCFFVADLFAASNEENVCRICMDAAIDCVMLECGHMASCIICGKQMNECPICRQYVVRVVRIFKP